MSFVKPHAIRDLQSKDAAQDLDSNFDAIWNALRQLRAGVEDIEDPIPGVVGRDGTPGPPGEDGADGEPGPPGVAGVAGAAGVTGAAGPETLGPMMMEGENSDEMWPIPGPQGPTGNTGAQGADGTAPLATMMLEPEAPDESWMMLVAGSSSSGGGWSLIEARACSASANEDFTNLSAYSEIFVIARSITKATTGLTSVRVSTDNGSTFLTASGDYESVAGTGITTVNTLISTHITNATAARTSFARIVNFNNGSAPKYAFAQVAGSLPEWVIPTTTALNAIRVFGSGGGNLTGGTIYVFGRI